MNQIIPEEPVLYIVAGLAVILLLVFILPFRVHLVEQNLEPFFLVMGILAVTISGLWTRELIIEALRSPVVIGSIPVGIFQVVLVFGILLYYLNQRFSHSIAALSDKLGLRVFIFLLIAILGILSSIVSVIVTAVLLSEIIAALPLERHNCVKLVVLTCFAVGLGAVLTPLGEPLSTILVQKLTGPPFNAGFLFPIEHFAGYVIPGVLAIAVLGSFWIGGKPRLRSAEIELAPAGKLRAVIFRAIRVYVFVAALVLLGEGLKPLVLWYIIGIPSFALYWINILSAVLDNATLTAVEVTTSLSISQIISIIMSLLIAGGMLIPGNIPNIVAANRLRISMKEWAKIGLPLGLIILAIYFLVLLPIIF